MADLEPIPYSDAKIRAILERVKTISLVGASANWNRPSYFVMKYLQGKGYRVIPVNPGIAGKPLLGEMAYASLRDIPDKVDMVDVFRNSDEAPGVVEDAIAIGAKVVWMQLGVRHDAAAKAAEAAGLEVIMNRCPKIEFGRLGGGAASTAASSRIDRRRPRCSAGSRLAQRRPAIWNTASKRAQSMPARRPIRRPARVRLRSIRRQPMCSTTSTTLPRSSTCTISATSIRG
jgi:O-acetylhomoserine (thiol)-lyase